MPILSERQIKKQKPKAKPNDFPIFSDIRMYRPHNQVFNIFPHGTFPKKIETILSFVKGISFREQMIYCNTFLKVPIRDKTIKKACETSMNKFWLGTTYSHSISVILKFYFLRIRELRWVFRKFLHIWRSRRLRMINTEDMCTLEVPKDPVYIVDWKNKIKSVFEASTLMRDITLRLLHHDGFFECAQAPRNPYTNLPLTQSQTISVWTQLALSRTSASSVFTEFRKSRWNLYTFVTEYSVSLQLHAFRVTMRNPQHEDYKDRLLDFIMYCYDQEDADCRTHVFDYAIKNCPGHPLLKRWAALCTRFYEAPIIFSKIPRKVITIQEEVLDSSISLLYRYKELERI